MHLLRIGELIIMRIRHFLKRLDAMTKKSDCWINSKSHSNKNTKNDGLSERLRSPFHPHQTEDDLMAAVAAAIQRSRGASALSAAAVAAARAKTEAAQRKSHRLRVANIKRWSMARAKLLEAVLDIDRAIQPEGMSLGMVDFPAHTCDLAAVQVQLAVLGRPSRAVLELVVFDDMAQRVRVVDAKSAVALPKLPTAPRTDKSLYCRIVLAYVEAALPHRIGGEDIICQRCGVLIPALAGDPLPSG